MKRWSAILVCGALIGCRTPFSPEDPAVTSDRTSPPPAAPLSLALPDPSAPSPVFAALREDTWRESLVQHERRRIEEEARQRELEELMRALKGEASTAGR
jgi:hypothetical protein